MFKGTVSGCCVSRCGMVLAVALLWSGTTASNAFGRACCLPDNGGFTCSDVTEEACDALGGAHGSQISVCDGFICGCPEEGLGCSVSCCFERGDCQNLPPSVCFGRNGVVGEDGSACSDPCTSVACAEACSVDECDIRACHLSDGSCVDTAEDACNFLIGGQDGGKGSSCDEPLNCDPFCGDGTVDDGEECDDGNNDDGDGCSANCTTEDDFAGCTPGFWKQPQHLQYWVGYNPNDSFDGTFGSDCFDPDITLLEGAKAKGGKVNALARHAVAALLNASSGEVNYPFSEAEVIAAVQDACATGEYNATKDDLEAQNELGCTVDKSQGDD